MLMLGSGVGMGVLVGGLVEMGRRQSGLLIVARRW